MLENNNINNKIEAFFNTKKDNWEYENPLLSPIPENQSDTYAEIALATSKEQEAWSDRAVYPSIHSPIQQENQSMLAPFVDELHKVGYFKEKDINAEFAKDIQDNNQFIPSSNIKLKM